MKSKFKVLVCGGRDFKSELRVHRELDAINRAKHISHIITGDATGADHFAITWSARKAKITWRYYANWTALGKSAGPIRNGTMLSDGQPDLVVAFPGGRGTADMVRQARSAGVEVKEIKDND